MDSWIHLLTKKSQHKVFRVCLQIRQRAFISYYKFIEDIQRYLAFISLEK